MRKRFGLLLMVLGLLLLAGAVVLLLHNRQEDQRAGDQARQVLEQILTQQPEREESERPASAAEPWEDPYLLEPAAEPEMTVVEIDGYGYIGYLSIPELELELPVMSEWDYDRMELAPCRYSGSTKRSDLVIVAHNYLHHFGRLKNLVPGSMLTFTDMDGKTEVYQVETVEQLDPYEVKAMTESSYDLTLFTCTYGGAQRVTVRCNRKEAD